MADDMSGQAGGEPPSFPVNAPLPPPPPPPPPVAPPSYPTSSGGGFPPPSFDTPGGVQYASWGIRLGGYLIDFVIFAVVLLVLYIPFRHSHLLQMHMVARRGLKRRTFSLAPFFIVAGLYVAYATILIGGTRGQTVGMMAVGIRVVRDGTLDAVDYGRAFGRAIFEQVLRLLSVVVFFLSIVWLLDMLWPLWDNKNQTLHDKALGTVVLRVRNAG
jgi:uncharacterized RDD family membrane protein YckC